MPPTPKAEDEAPQGGLEALIDQMSKLPQLLEELGGRISGLEEREQQRSSSSPSGSGSASFSLEPLGKAIESMTREFTATIRELAGGGRSSSPPPPETEETSPPQRRRETVEKPPPPPSPEPPPPNPAASRVRDFLGTPSLR